MNDKTLQSIIERQEAEISRLEDANGVLEREIENRDRSSWPWPLEIDGDTRLPVPRLEFRYEVDDYRIECTQWLILRHFCDHLEGYPLGRTTVNGRPGVIEDGKFWYPFRDSHHAVHNAEQLGLEVFCVHEGQAARFRRIDDRFVQEMVQHESPDV